MQSEIALTTVYSDAWRVYRLLMRRSILTAAIVFTVIGLADLASRATTSSEGHWALALTAFVIDFAGPVIVQGALVEIVRNVHEGRHPERIRGLFGRTERRFWSLLWASLVYGFGVIFGLIALIVPGLLAAARWCLMAPLIMLEGNDARAARRRSSELVRGQTAPVLAIVVINYLLLGLPVLLFSLFLPVDAVTLLVIRLVWSSLTAPFDAHVLTVIYYRLTEPERPVIHEDVSSWDSVWEAA